MKFTNETLKQQPSEDFTGIAEDESYDKTAQLSTQYKAFEIENSENLHDYERCKEEIKTIERDMSPFSKVVKVS
jgi:hypothetical protein